MLLFNGGFPHPQPNKKLLCVGQASRCIVFRGPGVEALAEAEKLRWQAVEIGQVIFNNRLDHSEILVDWSPLEVFLRRPGRVDGTPRRYLRPQSEFHGRAPRTGLKTGCLRSSALLWFLFPHKRKRTEAHQERA